MFSVLILTLYTVISKVHSTNTKKLITLANYQLYFWFLNIYKYVHNKDCKCLGLIASV